MLTMETLHSPLTQSIPHSLSFRRNLTRHSHKQLHNPSHTVCHSAGISLVTHKKYFNTVCHSAGISIVTHESIPPSIHTSLRNSSYIKFIDFLEPTFSPSNLSISFLKFFNDFCLCSIP